MTASHFIAINAYLNFSTYIFPLFFFNVILLTICFLSLSSFFFLASFLSVSRRQSHRQKRQSHPGDRGQVWRGSRQDRGRQRQKASPGGGRQAGGWQGRHCRQQRGEWTVRLVSQNPPPSSSLTPFSLLSPQLQQGVDVPCAVCFDTVPLCCFVSFLVSSVSSFFLMAFNTHSPPRSIRQLCWPCVGS